MAFDIAVEKRDALREEADRINTRLKEIRSQEKVMSDIYTLYFEMPAPAIEKDMVPDQPGRKQGEENDSDRMKTRTRITIHRSLIREEDDLCYYVKVPGISAVMGIPKRDCLLYKSGEILSAFLYEEDDYFVKTENSEEEKRSGAEMKAYFKKQKDRYNESGRGGKVR